MIDLLVWPATVAFCVLIFFAMFRKDISTYISRVSALNVTGIGSIASDTGQVEKAQSSRPVDVLSKTEDRGLESRGADIEVSTTFQEMFQSPILLEQVQRIRDHLLALNCETGTAREELILKSLAANQIALSFEKTYILLFGSQILALHHLAQRPEAGGIPVEHLRPYYDSGVSSGLDSARTSFEAWNGFLAWEGLGKLNGDQIAVTVRGREFLKYLLDQGYPFAKGG